MEPEYELTVTEMKTEGGSVLRAGFMLLEKEKVVDHLQARQSLMMDTMNYGECCCMEVPRRLLKYEKNRVKYKVDHDYSVILIYS